MTCNKNYECSIHSTSFIMLNIFFVLIFGWILFIDRHTHYLVIELKLIRNYLLRESILTLTVITIKEVNELKHLCFFSILLHKKLFVIIYNNTRVVWKLTKQRTILVIYDSLFIELLTCIMVIMYAVVISIY